MLRLHLASWRLIPKLKSCGLTNWWGPTEIREIDLMNFMTDQFPNYFDLVLLQQYQWYSISVYMHWHMWTDKEPHCLQCLHNWNVSVRHELALFPQCLCLHSDSCLFTLHSLQDLQEIMDQEIIVKIYYFLNGPVNKFFFIKPW